MMMIISRPHFDVLALLYIFFICSLLLPQSNIQNFSVKKEKNKTFFSFQ